MKKYTAYHFSRNDDCLGYGDGRKIVLGETLSVEGKPKLCNHGLHGSVSIVDALGYAAGSHLWRVEIWGSVDSGEDKLCGTHRKSVVQYGDLLPVIVEFASWCAKRAREHAEPAGESAKSAAESAKSAAEYAAKSAAESAKSAAEYAAFSAAEYAKSAAEYARYAAESAEYARYAAESAKSAAEYAAFSAAEYARYAAKSAESADEPGEYAARSEKALQEQWWKNKLEEL